MAEALDRRELLRRAGLISLGTAGLGAVAGCAGEGDSRAAAPRRPPLGDLARATRGTLITPGSGAYARARQVVNARYSATRPAAILQAADAADVRQAVLWCARNEVAIAARSGGHSYAGYCTRAGGLVVDLRRLSGIRIAPDGRSVQVGAGTLLIDLYSALARRGLGIPAGSCPTVAVGGLALGGGVGLASRAWGTTSDNVLALTVVTADGRIRVADARREPDLYWACRGGGGGNFGIATGFTLRTHPVRSASYFFASFAWSDLVAVVARWQRWAPNAPDALFTICSLSTGAGSPTLTVFGQYLGPSAGLRRLLGGLTAGARPRSLTVRDSGWLDLQKRWAGCLGESDAACRLAPRDLFAAKSDYVSSPLSAAGIRLLGRAIERRQARPAGGSGAILLDSYGGAINRVAPGATAFVHRDALYSIQYLAYWGSASGAAPGLEWIRGAHAAMRPHVSGFAYQNYIDPELAGWQRAYYGSNLARLRQVVARYDPDRLFHFRQAIPPA